jgi:hypothetical protein
MFKFFADKKYNIYTKKIIQNGAGDTVQYILKGFIFAYTEPVNGENLIGSELGNDYGIELVIYTQNSIHTGDLISIPDSNNDSVLFEIKRREFYKMPFFNYFKGYMVKTDENIRI